MNKIPKIVVKKMYESRHKSSCYFIEEKSMQQNVFEKESRFVKDDKTEKKEQENKVIIYFLLNSLEYSFRLVLSVGIQRLF